MKRLAAIAFPPLMMIMMTTAAHAQSEQDKSPARSSGRAQLLTTGRISKIDTKKRILTVRTEGATSGQPRETEHPRRTGGGPGGGIGGGGRRRGGIGFPGSGSPFPGGGEGRRPFPEPADNGKEFKVAVTDQTAIKNSNNSETSMSFLNLVVGDHITIQGLPTKGDNLEATQITLTNR